MNAKCYAKDMHEYIVMMHDRQTKPQTKLGKPSIVQDPVEEIAKVLSTFNRLLVKTKGGSCHYPC